MSKNINKILLVVGLVLLTLWIDNRFLSVNIDKYLSFHLVESSLFMVSSYLSVLFLLVLLSIILLASKKIISYTLLFIYITLWLLDINYKLIGGDGFNVNELTNIIHSPEFILEALSTYFSLKAVIYSSLIILYWIVVYIIVNKYIFVTKFSFKLSFSFIMLILFIDIVVYKKIHHFYHYPTNIRLLHTSVNKLILTAPLRKRIIPIINKSKKKLNIDNVIFIVDESIRGDILSLNKFHIDTTPYLRTHSHDIINLGVAVSSFTESYESNLIMRTGVREGTLPDTKRINEKNMPLVYYAKQMGYYTTILDAQGSGIVNGLRKSDEKYIDKIISHKDLNCSIPFRDHKFINIIANTINKHKKNYIFFNKYGSHFKYEDTYPLKKQYMFTPNKTYKEKRLNNYYNSLRWSVDDFWKQLVSRIKNKNVVVIYVSDHGQSLMEDPHYKRTHAGNKVEQSIVPLWLYAPDKVKKNLFENFGIEWLENKNHLTQFEIFPTILKLMGIKTNQLSIFDKINFNRKIYYFAPNGGMGRLQIIQKCLYNKKEEVLCQKYQ